MGAIISVFKVGQLQRLKEKPRWLLPYETWRHKYLRVGVEGRTAYIAYNADGFSSENKLAATCSEAIGYGMLLAVLANDRSNFTMLFKYYVRFSNQKSGLMSWQTQLNCKTRDDEVAYEASAFDGDADVAYALLLAADKWPWWSYEYKMHAKHIIEQLAAHCVSQVTKAPLLGDWVGRHGTTGDGPISEVSYSFVTRCSDHLLGHFLRYQREDTSSSKLWAEVFSRCLEIMDQQLQRHGTGLMPDFMIWSEDTSSYVPVKGKILEREQDGIFHYNSARTPWRLAVYYHETKDERVLPHLWAMTDFFEAEVLSDVLVAGYHLDGQSFGQQVDIAFSAPVLGLFKLMGRHQAAVKLETSIKDRIMVGGQTSYYGDTILMLVQLQLKELFSESAAWHPAPPRPPGFSQPLSLLGKLELHSQESFGNAGLSDEDQTLPGSSSNRSPADKLVQGSTAWSGSMGMLLYDPNQPESSAAAQARAEQEAAILEAQQRCSLSLYV